MWSEAKNEARTKELKEWVNKNGDYEEISSPMFAAYDPPWTLSFFRKNEVMFEVKKRRP